MTSVQDATRTTDGSGNAPYEPIDPLRSRFVAEYGYTSPAQLYLDYDPGLFSLDVDGRLSMTPAAVAGIQMQAGDGLSSRTDLATGNMVWDVHPDDTTLVLDPNTHAVRGNYAGADGIQVNGGTISGKDLQDGIDAAKTAADDAQTAADEAKTTADEATTAAQTAQTTADGAAAAAAAAQATGDAASASAAAANAAALANSIAISGKQDAGDYATNTALTDGLALKEDKVALKALAYKVQADWNLDLLNKPDLTQWSRWDQLGDLATKTQADWNLDIANRPDLTLYELKGNLRALAYKAQADWNTDVLNRPDLSQYQPLSSVLTSLAGTTPTLSNPLKTVGVIPSTTNASDLGSAANTWRNVYYYNLYPNAAGRVFGLLIAGTDNTYDLGNASTYWRNVYHYNLYPATAGRVFGSLVPDANNTRSLGASGNAWNYAYVNNLTLTGTFTGNLFPTVSPYFAAGSGISLTTNSTTKVITITNTGTGGANLAAVASNIVPAANVSYDLGTPSLAWGQVYAANLVAGGPFVNPLAEGSWVGWNRTGNGVTCFANHRGLGSGGWEWVGYDSSGAFTNVAMTLYPSGTVSARGNLELGDTLTADAPCYVDLHATPNVDYSARILRLGGVDGALRLDQTGLGDFLVTRNGTTQVTVDQYGNVTAGNQLRGYMVSVDNGIMASPGNALNLFSAGSNPIYVMANLVPSNDNSITLGDGAHRWQLVYSVNGTVSTSDENEKTDILPLTTGLDFVERLNPISFRFASGTDRKVHMGLGARETKATMDALGMQDHGLVMADEGPWGMAYSELIGPLIKAVQELSGRVKDLQKRLDAFEAVSPQFKT
jgi:hypothetical protein